MKTNYVLKSIIIALIIGLSPLTLKSQTEWIPDGAKWYYTTKAFWNEGYQKLYYEKDTIIHGLDFKSISSKFVFYNHLNGTINIIVYPNEYQLRVDSNIVYWYHNNLDTIFALYDFNSKVGDLWIIPPHPHASVEDTTEFGSYAIAEIIDIDYLEINKDSLKRYHIKNYSSHDGSGSLNYYLSGPIIEKIGSEIWPFPFPRFIADFYNSWGLRCYEDNEFPLHNFDPLTPCDFTVGLNYILLNEKITISPNPVIDRLRIECNDCCDQIKNLTFSSLGGNVLKTFSQLNNCDISIPGLSAGPYILRFSINNKTYSYKIIKI